MEAALREGGRKGRGAFLHPATVLLLVHPSYSNSQAKQNRGDRTGRVQEGLCHSKLSSWLKPLRQKAPTGLQGSQRPGAQGTLPRPRRGKIKVVRRGKRRAGKGSEHLSTSNPATPTQYVHTRVPPARAKAAR